eukprot:15454745-Alexandrium_andersonii.AAC.1
MASTRAPLATSAMDCKAAHRIPGAAGQPCIEGWHPCIEVAWSQDVVARCRQAHFAPGSVYEARRRVAKAHG